MIDSHGIVRGHSMRPAKRTSATRWHRNVILRFAHFPRSFPTGIRATAYIYFRAPEPEQGDLLSDRLAS